MQEQNLFSNQLKHYLDMIITIWPSLKLGLRNISNISSPHGQSYLPKHSYSSMSEDTFRSTIIEDLHEFIMSHDVKQETLQDYFLDVLDLVLINEEYISPNAQVGGAKHMARQLSRVIMQLQEGNSASVKKFEETIYKPVLEMGGVADAMNDGEDDDNSDGDNKSDSDEQNWNDQDDDSCELDEQNQLSKQEKRKIKQEKIRLEEQREKELQDDGWCIVKKKR